MLCFSNFVLDIYNLIFSIMNKSKTIVLLLVGLTLFFTIGILGYSQMAEIQPKMIIIYSFIGIIALISIVLALKKMREQKEGQPIEDEFTTQIKHKAGFHAYIISMYMWLFLFLLRGFFSDVETLVGSGILLSGLIGFICKAYIKRYA